MKPINQSDLIQNIAIGSIYVSPNSVYKTASINHIIDTIHLLRAQYDNRINYLIAGDLNRVKVDKILDSYGPLRQIITASTRKSAILDKATARVRCGSVCRVYQYAQLGGGIR